jgi:hypothetical protein
MLMLRFENVCDPEQPLKACPIVMLVTISFAATVKAIDDACAVVPLHWPA